MKSRLAEITSGVGHKTSWLIRRYDGLLTLLAWYVEQAGSVQLSGVRLSVCLSSCACGCSGFAAEHPAGKRLLDSGDSLAPSSSGTAEHSSK